VSKDVNRAKKERKASRNPAKRHAILRAAEIVFAGKGFHEATISDIAEKAHVSEATIYEYFSSKEELLFSIPAEVTRDHLSKSKEALEYVRGAANRLRMLIYRHLRLYSTNPNYAKVVMLILKSNRNFLKTDSYKVIQESAGLTIKVIKEGIASGEFRSDLNPYLVRAMIWGSVEHLVIRKSMLGKPEELLPLADEITNTLFQGILVPGNERAVKIHLTLEKKE
jgi:AcrR family transcriptional regulator